LARYLAPAIAALRAFLIARRASGVADLSLFAKSIVINFFSAASA
jgi:hypothetical protein